EEQEKDIEDDVPAYLNPKALHLRACLDSLPLYPILTMINYFTPLFDQIVNKAKEDHYSHGTIQKLFDEIKSQFSNSLKYIQGKDLQFEKYSGEEEMIKRLKKETLVGVLPPAPRIQIRYFEETEEMKHRSSDMLWSIVVGTSKLWDPNSVLLFDALFGTFESI
ncbi:MAG: hypothetical protein EZS28_051806, partial [Streblomastix strix]